jgi:ADP-ribose pyrophosphatase YjhB (NUDIX family)
MVTISAGLVIIYDNKILLVHPTGQKWYETYSIPKGHVEEDEDYLDAAIRETTEEIGIRILTNQIDFSEDKYIEYKDKNGETYKRVYYYLVYLTEELDIDKSKLQKKEVDWAGFLTKEEAEKRIFWRFKPLLKYLDKPMKVKLVKESLYEKFTEEGDPLYDMGIGLLPTFEKELQQKYHWSRGSWVEPKDTMRIQDIIRKANGDPEKENKLAQTMCKLIQERLKAYRRFLAAKEEGGMNWEVTKIFLRRAAELAGLGK